MSAPPGQNHRVKVVMKKAITFTCSSCGNKTRFDLPTPLTCGHCGKIYTYTCLACGYEFQLGEHVEYCIKCGWFRCPKCGSCGCVIKKIIRAFKQLKEILKGEGEFSVFGLMSHSQLKGVEIMKEKYIVKGFFHSEVLEKEERRKKRKLEE